MNKFKPLFDIPLAKYDTLEAYPPPDEVKRAIEAHLVNHQSDIPKKPTAGKPTEPTPSEPAASINANVAKPSKKRKRGEDKKPTTSDSTSERPICPTCGRRHGGECWMKNPEKIPQATRERMVKRRKQLNEMLKDNTGQ
jgi:hypothetical protein